MTVLGRVTLRILVPFMRVAGWREKSDASVSTTRGPRQGLFSTSTRDFDESAMHGCLLLLNPIHHSRDP